MEGKNIPPLITLSAAMIACVICILRRAPLYNTLLIVLIVLIVFYIIGRIVQKVVVKINTDAEEAALQRQREEQEAAAAELAAAELAAAELAAEEEKAKAAEAEQKEVQQNTETTESGKPKMTEGFGDLWNNK